MSDSTGKKKKKEQKEEKKKTTTLNVLFDVRQAQVENRHGVKVRVQENMLQKRCKDTEDK